MCYSLIGVALKNSTIFNIRQKLNNQIKWVAFFRQIMDSEFPGYMHIFILCPKYLQSDTKFSKKSWAYYI